MRCNRSDELKDLAFASTAWVVFVLLVLLDAAT